jgi:fucose 4-O-acetylase-like acetyltransferase
MTNLKDILEPIANIFRNMGIPEPITHWGHPLMMGIVIFAMGTFVGISGWRARTSTDEEVATKSRTDHRKAAPLMFLFLALGYTGGLLSLVMQKQPILESPHFWTGSVVLILLATNGVLSAGFGNDKGTLRTIHAYLGSVALVLLFIHAALGLKLGFSI